MPSTDLVEWLPATQPTYLEQSDYIQHRTLGKNTTSPLKPMRQEENEAEMDSLWDQPCEKAFFMEPQRQKSKRKTQKYLEVGYNVREKKDSICHLCG